MKYPNLIKGLIASCPNHIWVSDITYIWIEADVCYLHLYRIEQMIQFYNYQRPHMSIGMKKPMDVYQGEVPGENLWKKKVI